MQTWSNECGVLFITACLCDTQGHGATLSSLLCWGKQQNGGRVGSRTGLQAKMVAAEHTGELHLKKLWRKERGVLRWPHIHYELQKPHVELLLAVQAL